MPRKLLINLEDTPAVTRAGTKLVEWALTKELPEEGTDQIDGRQVKEILEEASIGLVFAGSVQKVVVHQSTDEVLHIVLSPKASLQASIDDIKASPPRYNIQPHYAVFVLDRRDGGGNFDDEQEVLDFYDFRVGDYTLQHCM